MPCPVGTSKRRLESELTTWIALIFIVGVGLLLIFNHDAGTLAGIDISDFARVSYYAAWLIVLLPLTIALFRGRLPGAVRDIAIWASFALILIAGYSYRSELFGIGQRVAGELLPPGTSLSVRTDVGDRHSVRLRRRPAGHFIAKTQVNGVRITMLVDTGASAVVLTQSDARAIGIDPAHLKYTVPVRTANGTTFSAPVRIQTLAIGPISLGGIDALIARPGALSQSLLGMSFLNRLRSYEFSGDFLTLRS